MHTHGYAVMDSHQSDGSAATWQQAFITNLPRAIPSETPSCFHLEHAQHTLCVWRISSQTYPGRSNQNQRHIREIQTNPLPSHPGFKAVGLRPVTFAYANKIQWKNMFPHRTWNLFCLLFFWLVSPPGCSSQITNFLAVEQRCYQDVCSQRKIQNPHLNTVSDVYAPLVKNDFFQIPLPTQDWACNFLLCIWDLTNSFPKSAQSWGSLLSLNKKVILPS